MEKQKTPAQTTSLHLLDVAYNIPFSPLSKIYFQNFINYCSQKSINLPEDYTKSRICLKCGVLIIPGLTQTTRIIYKKVKNHPRKRLLQNSCLQCNYSLIYDGLLTPKESEPVPEKIPFEAKWPIPSTNERKLPSNEDNNKPFASQQGLSNSTTYNINKQQSSSAKKRAKKRKENSLSNLLTKKKQEVSKSLSLMDFMK